jgi:hypothetical protein
MGLRTCWIIKYIFLDMILSLLSYSFLRQYKTVTIIQMKNYVELVSEVDYYAETSLYAIVFSLELGLYPFYSYLGHIFLCCYPFKYGSYE